MKLITTICIATLLSASAFADQPGLVQQCRDSVEAGPDYYKGNTTEEKMRACLNRLEAINTARKLLERSRQMIDACGNPVQQGVLRGKPGASGVGCNRDFY
jgi:hypothetical protein